VRKGEEKRRKLFCFPPFSLQVSRQGDRRKGMHDVEYNNSAMNNSINANNVNKPKSFYRHRPPSSASRNSM
jgi:hypothetical protein